MRGRFASAVLAAAGTVVVTWPLVGLDARQDTGWSLAIVPALKLGLVVLAIGTVYTLLLEGWAWLRRGRVAEAPHPVPGREALRWSALGCLVLFAAGLPVFAPGRWVGLGLETLVYATLAIGLNITIGMAGLLVLGHAAFWAVGAYAFALLTIHLHWNFWLAFPAAGAAAALTGLAIGLPGIRLRGDYLAVVTLGFGEAVRWVLKNVNWITGGDAGIPSSEIPGSLRARQGWLGTWLWQPGAGKDVRAECYYFALALAIVCVVCVALLKRSRFGRALLALREDETAAQCMGIRTTRTKLIAFASSAMWAGLAGVIHPIYLGQITPDVFDFNASALFVAMVVLGGLGSVTGSVLGAALLFVIPQLLRNWVPEVQEYRMLVFGAVMAAMMVVRPQGLVGARSRRPERPRGGPGNATGAQPAGGGSGGTVEAAG